MHCLLHTPCFITYTTFYTFRLNLKSVNTVNISHDQLKSPVIEITHDSHMTMRRKSHDSDVVKIVSCLLVLFRVLYQVHDL